MLVQFCRLNPDPSSATRIDETHTPALVSLLDEGRQVPRLLRICGLQSRQLLAQLPFLCLHLQRGGSGMA